MSTHACIRSLQEAGVLFPYVPPRTRRLPKRRLFLTKRARMELITPDSATNMLCGRGNIENALTRWVLGDRIYGSKTSRFLADLTPPPPEVWEVRVIEPSVQVRLFGRFAEPDTLILTQFHTRDHLGPKESKAWSDAMTETVKQWDDFEPNLPVFSANTIREYVTENCDDFQIKRPPNGQPKPRAARTGRIRRR